MDCILFTSTTKYAQHFQLFLKHTLLSTRKLFLTEKKLQALGRDSVDKEK